MPEGASFYNRNVLIHSIYSLVQSLFSDRKNSNKMPLDATLLMHCSGKKDRKGLFKRAWVKAMECKTQKYSPLVTVESGNEWKGIAAHEKYSANCRTCCCFNSVLENKCELSDNKRHLHFIHEFLTSCSRYVASLSVYLLAFALLLFCSMLFTCKTHRCIFLHGIKFSNVKSRFVIHFLVPQLRLQAKTVLMSPDFFLLSPLSWNRSKQRSGYFFVWAFWYHAQRIHIFSLRTRMLATV